MTAKGPRNVLLHLNDRWAPNQYKALMAVLPACIRKKHWPQARTKGNFCFFSPGRQELETFMAVPPPTCDMHLIVLKCGVHKPAPFIHWILACRYAHN